jgi:Fic family protein
METPSVKAQRLLEQVYAMRKGNVDTIPNGYFSANQYAKMWKMGRTNTERFLKELVESGTIKQVRLRQIVKGRITVLSFYG